MDRVEGREEGWWLKNLKDQAKAALAVGRPDCKPAIAALEKRWPKRYGPMVMHQVDHTHVVSLPSSAQQLLDRLASMAETGQLEAPTCPIPAIDVQSEATRVSAS